MVHTGDFTYTSSTGYYTHHKDSSPDKIPFGSAFGCSGSKDGQARINLVGTPFAVNDTFTAGGYLPAGTATCSSNDQVVDIIGGGSCGWMVPTKANAQGDAASTGGWYLKLKLVA